MVEGKPEGLHQGGTCSVSLLLPGKAEVINAREVAPGLASAHMFNSSEQSEEGEEPAQDVCAARLLGGRERVPVLGWVSSARRRCPPLPFPPAQDTLP